MKEQTGRANQGEKKTVAVIPRKEKPRRKAGA